MVKVKCFALSGIECIFPSLDHEPAHFHAKRRGEWAYKVIFQERKERMLEVVWEKKRMTKSQRKELLLAVEVNRAELIKQWEEECRKKGMKRNDD